jgi:hypothetical protein
VLAPLQFALTGASTQKPPTRTRGVVVTLSCPRESCRVAMKAVLTIPSPRVGGRVSRANLRSSTVQVARATKRKHTFAVSARLRARIARALRTARTRRGVRVVVTGTARDAAGRRPATRTKTINVRR